MYHRSVLCFLCFFVSFRVWFLVIHIRSAHDALSTIATNVSQATVGDIINLNKVLNIGVPEEIIQLSNFDGSAMCSFDTLSQLVLKAKKARQPHHLSLWKLYAVVQHCMTHKALPETTCIADWIKTKKPELESVFRTNGVTAAMMMTMDALVLAPIFDVDAAELQELKNEFAATRLSWFNDGIDDDDHLHYVAGTAFLLPFDE